MIKKILIGLLNLLLIGLLTFNITTGFNKYFEELEVYNIHQIVEETDRMYSEMKINETQKKENHPRALSSLESSYKDFKDEQQKYKDKLEVSTYVYKVEKLFVKLGNKATQEGVQVKMDVTNSVAGQNMYDISFTAEGSYISIIDFISSIENDSELGFKIEKFKMIPGGSTSQEETSQDIPNEQSTSSGLTATFICKDILIEDMEMQSTPETDTPEDPEMQDDMEGIESPSEGEANND